jgi:hypothetical protein
MKKLLRLRFPVLLIVALPLLYLGAFFAWVAVDAHVLGMHRWHRVGFGPVEWLIDETPGVDVQKLGTYSIAALLRAEQRTRNPKVLGLEQPPSGRPWMNLYQPSGRWFW